jgi:membrane protease YdiL (CAAX protease family)
MHQDLSATVAVPPPRVGPASAEAGSRTIAAPDRAAGAAGRREVRLFLGLTFGLAVLSMALARVSGANAAHPTEAPLYGQLALYGTALWPALSALIARKVVVGRVRNTGFGFRRAPFRWLAIAWALPLVATIAGYVPVWVGGLGHFDLGHLAETVGLGSVPGLGASVGLLAGVTVGLLPWVLLAIGEEVGWRGLLVPRLAERMDESRVALVSGVVWASFHLPLLLLVPGASETNVLFATVVFAIGVVGLAYPITLLRLRTGSIWPPVVFHAMANAALYFVCGPLTRKTAQTEWWAGETGALTAAVGTVVLLLAWRRLRRS